jgi:hypothetical protein
MLKIEHHYDPSVETPLKVWQSGDGSNKSKYSSYEN